MNTAQIKIPKVLHELHGKQATIIDLILTYTAGLALCLALVLQGFAQNLSMLNIVLLGVLGLDIGGGVVANFTKGVKDYYQANARLRYTFILFHIIQPLVLAFIFPNNLLGILLVAVYTLLSMLVLNFYREQEFQKPLSALFCVIGFMLILLVNFPNVLITTILSFFIIKLLLGHSQKN